MTPFFNFKNPYQLLKVIVLCCALSVPLGLRSQTDLSRQSIGLSAADSTLIRKSFQLIPADNYAYIAIHSDNTNTGFKILENNSWKPMSGLSLAAWIAVDRSYDGKTIVLLSCNDSTSTQNLATALGDLDRNAKRKLRTIIGWDNAVSVFENGFISGYGACKRFSAASTAGVITAPVALTASEIPVGNPNGYPSYWLQSVVLAIPKDPIIAGM